MRNEKILIAALIAITAALQLLDAQKQPYHPGEKVTYQIKYGIVGSGQASLELSEGFHKGQPVWHAVISGKTTGLADALYRVRDVYESYIDPENDLPVFSIRNIREDATANTTRLDLTTCQKLTQPSSSVTSQVTIKDRKGSLTLSPAFTGSGNIAASGKELIGRDIQNDDMVC